MNIDKQTRYTASSDFFELRGSVVMKLSAEAAIEVCMIAADRGLVIARIEGGIWHNPGFEARVDCIWDGIDPPTSVEDARLNNLAAADFVVSELDQHDTFVITAPSIHGW
ncbi:colicin immunity protein [Paraburkholderia phymatum]|uniref:Colicin immunity protein n=1 Tax=Paraburkholderia phymatum TaxID=148447 RepID=A0ACC6U3V8_9BURK